MSQPSEPSAGLEPTVETIELVCDHLADLGLVIGPDTARDLIRAILAAEAPRLDARVRDALGTSLETVRIATQSALGLLAATAPAAVPAGLATPVAPAAATPVAAASAPAKPPAPAAPIAPPKGVPLVPAESRRPIARRGALKPSHEPFPPVPTAEEHELDRDRRGDDPGARPVFKRPRGR